MKKEIVVTRNRILMGCPFSIKAFTTPLCPENRLVGFMDIAFAEIKRIEDLLTDFRESPFNQINQYAGRKPVKVSKEIFELIEQSLEISKDSQGAFDISYASVGLLWRHAFKNKILPTETELEEARQYVNFKNIILDHKKSEVYLPHPKMKIGMGGVGKGYAVDRASQFLKSAGIDSFFVNGAGDIRVSSSQQAPRPWRIGLRNPFANKDSAMGFIELSQGAIATSGDYERSFMHQGKKYHHIIDARTGKISEGVVSATVFARSALVADLMATTTMILGDPHGMQLLNQKGSLFGFIIKSNGLVVKSDSIHDFNNQGKNLYA